MAEADDWVVLETLEAEEEAQIVCGFLESRGIPCRLGNTHSHEFPVNVGALGQVRLLVSAGQREEALRLIAERESMPAEDAGE